MIWDRADASMMGLQGGLERPPSEWAAEFADLVARSGRDCAFLAQIHIYVLANVLRRPIIVYADTVQEHSPCRMRGLYLPMERLVTGAEIERVPLLLAFEGALSCARLARPLHQFASCAPLTRQRSSQRRQRFDSNPRVLEVWKTAKDGELTEQS